MSSDRELLEAAAKAAGKQIHHWSKILPGPMVGDDPDMHYWNPLEEDHDAFRLSIQLGIVPQYAKRYVVAIHLTDAREIACHEDYGDDPYAATRRCIVRAAAALAPTPKEKAE